MKKLQIISVVLMGLLLSGCKKEKLPGDIVKVTCLERCNYVSDFVGHRWKQVGDCDDSSAFALSHIGLMPLPTSYSYRFDSCDTDNEWVINSDGTSYLLNPLKCYTSEPDTFTQPRWKFSDDRTQLIFIGASTFYIESITPSEMKMYYYYTSTSPGHPSVRYVRLWTFKSI